MVNIKLKDIHTVELAPHPFKQGYLEILVYTKPILEGERGQAPYVVKCAKSSPVGKLIEPLYKHLEMHINADDD